ncbi:MAG: hypothetical protein WCD04_02975 [Terriglobia bacterium]
MLSILVVSACLLPTAFPLTPNLESLTTETCSLPLRREVHAAQEVVEARGGAQEHYWEATEAVGMWLRLGS